MIDWNANFDRFRSHFARVKRSLSVFLKPELQRLNHCDLKYWPDIAGIIRSLGMDGGGGSLQG